MIKINCTTKAGGSVTLNKRHGVTVSYAMYPHVTAAGDSVPAEILYTWAKLRDGSSIQFFLNRETGLIVVDHIAKSGKCGVEIVRTKL